MSADDVVSREIVLTWRRFRKMTEARDSFADVPSVYVQTDNRGVPVRVGETSVGLESRYRGGNAFALDAAMHNSGNLVFVAEVPERLSGEIERELIWRERQTLLYNNEHKSNPPPRRMRIRHEGERPRFSDTEAQE